MQKEEEYEEESEVVEEDAGEEPDDQGNFLVPRQTYLASGIHIGMKQKSEHMKRFIYKVRPDGLAVLNIQMIDDRIRIAAKSLANVKKIAIVSRRNISQKAAGKFAEIIGAHSITGRFMPGSFTNPDYKDFFEADIVIVMDPTYDYQALNETTTARIPVIAICGTSNELNNIDFIIPANNKSMKSVSTLLWILAREILKERGEIKSNEEYTHDISEFVDERFKPVKNVGKGGWERGRGRGMRPRNK